MLFDTDYARSESRSSIKSSSSSKALLFAKLLIHHVQFVNECSFTASFSVNGWLVVLIGLFRWREKLLPRL